MRPGPQSGLRPRRRRAATPHRGHRPPARRPALSSGRTHQITGQRHFRALVTADEVNFLAKAQPKTEA